MRHLQQPQDSKLCGQCCVAMLLDVEISKAIALVGHAGPTSPDQLIRAIRKGGRNCDPSLIVGRPRGTCLVKLNRPGRRSGNFHWVVYDRGVWHDPGQPAPNSVSRGDATSYIMVF